MRARFLVFSLLFLPFTTQAQHGPGGGSAPAVAPREAAQFDFLIGQWEGEVKVPPEGLAQRIHGAPKLKAAWKAWRAFDGWGIEDELRIMNAGGTPLSLSHTLRVWDSSAARWTLTALDVFRARYAPSTAEWRANRMTQSWQGSDLEGKAFVARATFFDITLTSFRYQQDRSYDGGRSWDEGVLRIEAKRVATTAAR